MKLSSGIILSILLLTTSFGYANETRMIRLADSSLIERLKQDGAWEVEVFDSKIEYSCLKCDGKVEATIEVIAPYEALQHPSRLARYLSERKSYCANLAINNMGRCTDASEVRFRSRVLVGLESKYIVADETKVEFALFYKEWQRPHELILGIVSYDQTADSLMVPGQFLKEHMARLTLLW